MITGLLNNAGWHVSHECVERIRRQDGGGSGKAPVWRFPTTLKVIQKQAKKGRLWLKDGSCVRLLPESPNHVSPASPNPTCSARTGPPPAHFARFACNPWCRANSFSQLMKSERENTTLKPTFLVLIRSCPHPPNPDRGGHREGREGGGLSLRCRTYHRSIADYRVGVLVGGGQAGAVTNLSVGCNWPKTARGTFNCSSRPNTKGGNRTFEGAAIYCKIPR